MLLHPVASSDEETSNFKLSSIYRKRVFLQRISFCCRRLPGFKSQVSVTWTRTSQSGCYVPSGNFSCTWGIPTASGEAGRTCLFIGTVILMTLWAHTSKWIVEVVKQAYSGAERQYDRITAHEVRALSTSWAYANQVALEDVLAAAFWRSSGVFRTPTSRRCLLLVTAGTRSDNVRKFYYEPFLLKTPWFMNTSNF